MGEVNSTKIDQWLAILSSKVEYLQYCLDRKKMHIAELTEVLNTYVLTVPQRDKLTLELESLNRDFVHTGSKLRKLKLDIQELELIVTTKEDIKQYEKKDEDCKVEHDNKGLEEEEVFLDRGTNTTIIDDLSSSKNESFSNTVEEKDDKERNIEYEQGVFSSFLNKFRRFKNNG